MLTNILFLGSVYSALCAGLLHPACAAASRLIERRCVAPLLRGTLERMVGLGACIWGALGTVAVAGVAARGLGVRLYPEEVMGVLALSSPLLGAVPWFAGELLTGPSQRGGRALAACLLLSTAASWGAASFFWSWIARGPWSDSGMPSAPLLAAGGALVTTVSWLVYLAVRGDAGTYSSSISEKRSLFGSSFGF